MVGKETRVVLVWSQGQSCLLKKGVKVERDNCGDGECGGGREGGSGDGSHTIDSRDKDGTYRVLYWWGDKWGALVEVGEEDGEAAVEVEIVVMVEDVEVEKVLKGRK